MDPSETANQERLDKAKALFFDYLGSKFGMGHDGVYDEYAQYGVGEAQEAAWRKELIALWVSRLSADDVSAAVKLHIMRAGEALPDLLTYAEQGDSYAQLIYANTLWEIASASREGDYDAPPEVLAEAKSVAVRIWRSIAADPIRLSPGRDWRPYDGSTPADFLQRWARRRLSQTGLPGVSGD